MPRAFIFPDPNDRSFNEPKVIVDQPKILGLYNQEYKPRPKRQVVTEEIKDWFLTEAKKIGWDSAEFVGNQCTLGVELPNKRRRENSDPLIPKETIHEIEKKLGMDIPMEETKRKLSEIARKPNEIHPPAHS